MEKRKARKYSSKIIADLLDQISPLEIETTRNKMVIAAKIDDVLQAKNMSKIDFARLMNSYPSEVSKWLSGNQNFTIDTLTEIAFKLKVSLKELIP